MITGFNTDVNLGETVYHVQTEDKGIGNPLIESLIYVKGAILDAYRTGYQAFLQSEAFSESTLQKILAFQHRQIVTAIRTRQFRKGMGLKAYVDGNFVFEFDDPKDRKGEGEKTADRHVNFSSENISPIQEVSEPTLETQSREVEPGNTKQVSEGRLGSSQPKQSQPAWGIKRLEVTRNKDIAPASKQPEPGPSRIDFALDADEAAELQIDEGIEICVESSKQFVAGSHVDLNLYVESRQNRVRLENVQVIFKIIGTTFTPRLYSGKTDQFGNLRMNFNLPNYSAGSAALIIQASTALGNDEIKYLIKRK